MAEEKNTQTYSRLGRKPVVMPDGVKVTVNNKSIEAEGKRGKLSWTLPELIEAKVEGKEVKIMPTTMTYQTKALHGLSRKIVLNMVEGVSKGFQKKLVIEGVGFRAQVQGQKLNMTLGFSHPVTFDVPKGISVKVEGKGQNELTIEGNDKQLVGEVAAQIRNVKKPEPYKGTGIRYDNETVHRKAGKAAVGAAGGGKK